MIVAFWSFDRGDSDERFSDTPANDAVQSAGFNADWEPALDVASQDALFAELFGQGVDASHVRQKAPGSWRLLLQGAESSPASQADDAREFLRTMIATSRRDVEFAQLVAIDRLYLSWLRQAEEEGACREVSGLSFFDGVPHMAGAGLDAERAVARQLLDSGELVWREPEGSGFEIPNPLLSCAEQRSGLGAERIIGAFASEAHPDRCRASIALLEAALDDPASVPRDLLAGI